MSEEVTKKILKEMEQMSKGGEGSGRKTPDRDSTMAAEYNRKLASKKKYITTAEMSELK